MHVPAHVRMNMLLTWHVPMPLQLFPAEGRKDHGRQLDLLSMWLRTMLDTDKRDLCYHLSMVSLTAHTKMHCQLSCKYIPCRLMDTDKRNLCYLLTMVRPASHPYLITLHC
jgi:hypothetical protein